jgi:3-deoxy-manno-octulosonate cytidylyltransferase (CMP-KDO synthetase)
MTIVIIPARYASTRFPGKPLAKIAGVSMIERVYKQCELAKGIAKVVVATEHEKVKEEVQRFGGRIVMTSSKHVSGTDRIFEAATLARADEDAIVINVQGDEPLIEPSVISAIAKMMEKDESILVGTPITLLTQEEEFTNPNVVKVVLDANKNALYFSRAGIPFQREPSHIKHYKHIGVYGYRMSALKRFTQLKEGTLEKSERLEQLRFLEAGVPIRCVEVQYESIAVDVPEDVAKVEARLAEK